MISGHNQAPVGFWPRHFCSRSEIAAELGVGGPLASRDWPVQMSFSLLRAPTVTRGVGNRQQVRSGRRPSAETEAAGSAHLVPIERPFSIWKNSKLDSDELVGLQVFVLRGARSAR